MPTNQLHNWPFHLWNGPDPCGERQHVAVHTRPGTAGAAYAKLGQWGDPIAVEISAYYASFLLANDAKKLIVEPLADAGLVRLWWNAIDFKVRYQTVFKVVAVGEVFTETHVHVVGGGLNWTNAAKLTARLTLIPNRAL